MKTIEERADAYVGHPYEIDEFSSVTKSRDAYIAGATEQKAIDEEVRLKKCEDMTKAEYEREVAFAEWYNKNGKGTPTYSDAIEWARREVIDQACIILCRYVCPHKTDDSKCLNDKCYTWKMFRRMMEE